MKHSQRRLIVAGVLAAWLVLPSIACDAQKQKPAENIIWESRNWSELYQAYKRYGERADGVVAGAFSEQISIFLADRWQALPELRRISNKDHLFFEFVVRNLDEAVPADRANRILTHAQAACPSRDEKWICEKLIETLQSPTSGVR